MWTFFSFLFLVRTVNIATVAEKVVLGTVKAKATSRRRRFVLITTEMNKFCFVVAYVSYVINSG